MFIMYPKAGCHKGLGITALKQLKTLKLLTKKNTALRGYMRLHEDLFNTAFFISKHFSLSA